jgi:hypothetical protein
VIAMTVFDRMTPEERADLLELAKAHREAEAAKNEHKAARLRVEDDIRELAYSQGRDYRAAASAYLGEKDAPGPSLSAGRSRSELDQISKGLRIRVQEDEAEIERTHKALCERLTQVAKVCMERAAADYLRASVEVGRLHAMIGGASELLRVAGANPDALDRDNWSSLFVPGSQGLAALRDRGEVLNPTWGQRVLAGGERTRVHTLSEQALGEIATAVKATIGVWPFAASGVVGTYLAAPSPRSGESEAAKTSRRAVLDRAAGALT